MYLDNSFTYEKLFMLWPGDMFDMTNSVHITHPHHFVCYAQSMLFVSSSSRCSDVILLWRDLWLTHHRLLFTKSAHFFVKLSLFSPVKERQISINPNLYRSHYKNSLHRDGIKKNEWFDCFCCCKRWLWHFVQIWIHFKCSVLLSWLSMAETVETEQTKRQLNCAILIILQITTKETFVTLMDDWLTQDNNKTHITVNEC